MVQVKTTETHGYNAVQIGYQVVPERKITKPELNHLKKSGAPPMRKLKEYRVSAASTLCLFGDAAAKFVKPVTCCVSVMLLHFQIHDC